MTYEFQDYILHYILRFCCWTVAFQRTTYKLECRHFGKASYIDCFGLWICMIPMKRKANITTMSELDSHSQHVFTICLIFSFTGTPFYSELNRRNKSRQYCLACINILYIIYLYLKHMHHQFSLWSTARGEMLCLRWLEGLFWVGLKTE